MIKLCLDVCFLKVPAFRGCLRANLFVFVVQFEHHIYELNKSSPHEWIPTMLIKLKRIYQFQSFTKNNSWIIHYCSCSLKGDMLGAWGVVLLLATQRTTPLPSISNSASLKMHRTKNDANFCVLEIYFYKLNRYYSYNDTPWSYLKDKYMYVESMRQQTTSSTNISKPPHNHVIRNVLSTLIIYSHLT